MIRFLLVLLTFCIAATASDKDSEETSKKKQNVKQRYFPVDWEPPSARSRGGAIVISPPKPNFESKKTYMEIQPAKSSSRVKDPVFKLTVRGITKTIRVGKSFKIGSKSYKFIGPEGDSYVIQDLKTKKKIFFKVPPKKK